MYSSFGDRIHLDIRNLRCDVIAIMSKYLAHAQIVFAQIKARTGGDDIESFLRRSALASVIWKTSGSCVSAQELPFINLTKPDAAVKIRAMPLMD
jgi:hypothetical protein